MELDPAPGLARLGFPKKILAGYLLLAALLAVRLAEETRALVGLHGRALSAVFRRLLPALAFPPGTRHRVLVPLPTPAAHAHELIRRAALLVEELGNGRTAVRAPERSLRAVFHMCFACLPGLGPLGLDVLDHLVAQVAERLELRPMEQAALGQRLGLLACHAVVLVQLGVRRVQIAVRREKVVVATLCGSENRETILRATELLVSELWNLGEPLAGVALDLLGHVAGDRDGLGLPRRHAPRPTLDELELWHGQIRHQLDRRRDRLRDPELQLLRMDCFFHRADGENLERALDRGLLGLVRGLVHEPGREGLVKGLGELHELLLALAGVLLRHHRGRRKSDRPGRRLRGLLRGLLRRRLFLLPHELLGQPVAQLPRLGQALLPRFHLAGHALRPLGIGVLRRSVIGHAGVVQGLEQVVELELVAKSELVPADLQDLATVAVAQHERPHRDHGILLAIRIAGCRAVRNRAAVRPIRAAVERKLSERRHALVQVVVGQQACRVARGKSRQGRSLRQNFHLGHGAPFLSICREF